MDLPVTDDFDHVATWKPLSSGFGDPTMRLDRRGAARATRTPDGPATLAFERVAEDRIRVEAWGPGAESALAHAADAIGVNDRPPAPPSDPILRSLARRARGLRLPRVHGVLEILTLVVLQQKITGREAARAHSQLLRHYSEPAPGPDVGLWLPLSAEQLRNLPSECFPPLGVPPRQGALLRELGFLASRVEETRNMEPGEAHRRLCGIPGIGPWSAGSVLLRGMGAADAIPVGDYHLPHIVAFNLRGNERSNDEEMLELLEPYRGQRGRVLRWITSAGRHPPRRGPRMPLRPLPPERGEFFRRSRRGT